MFERAATLRILAASLVLSAGLLLVGWFDYASTRRELLTLLVDQAASLRQTVAAAARSGEAAATQAQAVLRARLLDNSRLLRELDKRGGLSQALLDDVVRMNQLFRVTVFAANGQRELASGSGGPPAGAGLGLGRGGGMGGGGPGVGAIAQRLLTGNETEAASEIHGSRWGDGWRLSAGVRRPRGGAIVLNVDAGEIAELSRQASIEHLLEEIATRAPEIAYVVLEDGSNRLAFGPLSSAATTMPSPATSTFATIALPAALEGLIANERVVSGRPVLEFGGPLNLTRDASPVLRLGLSLEGLRTAEQRTLTRLVLSLLAAFALGVVTIAFVTLRQRFGVLSEKHALAEDALRRHDRLAAMGELAATVAHEVRNPLNAIGMSVQRLRREFSEVPASAHSADQTEQRELLDVLSGETQRINRIVQQFLDFARPPGLTLRPTDLGEVVGDVVTDLRATAATRGVMLEVDTARAGKAMVDPDQLKQAVDNLVRNAIEASSNGGRVAVRVYRAASGHTIEIEDAGSGIPADILPRIFDLYFTTKTAGTGVGLAVTHQIVEAHGGTIEVDSRVGEGTRMLVTIPHQAGAESRG
jgi:signal transduction histidine kinase